MSETVWLVGGDAALSVPPDRVTVWLVSLDDPAARKLAERAPLAATDLTAMARFADGGGRLARRRLAKLLLAAATGTDAATVAIDRAANGDSRVTAPMGWHLSVAARWPDCAIAVARRRIGVDVERLTDQPLPHDLLTEAERAWLATLPVDRQCSESAAIWAAKEAHAKWTGEPLALDPAAIETADERLVTSRYGATRCWCRIDGTLATAVCAAA